jgi:uncharacterized protein (TIGR03437 family)
VTVRRAAPGDRLRLSGIGFGATDPVVAAGRIARDPAVLPNVVIRAGGAEAAVEYAGVAQGSVGAYELRFIVPDGLSGDVPITVSVDGVTVSQELFLAVRNAE